MDTVVYKISPLNQFPHQGQKSHANIYIYVIRVFLMVCNLINYIKLILISASFAIPTAYIFSYTFYQQFAFRPELSLWVLPAALFFIMILALLTISSQTVKAALINPAASLRED
jgi:hypothetical protein